MCDINLSPENFESEFLLLVLNYIISNKINKWCLTFFLLKKTNPIEKF